MSADDAVDWQTKYMKLKESYEKHILQLGDENDLLSQENLLLKTENERLKALLNPTPAVPADLRVPEELLIEGNSTYPTRCVQVLEGTHSFGNLLSVAIYPLDPSIIATGGVDKYVTFHNWRTGTKLAEFNAEAPVLSLSFQGNILGLACMDGRIQLLRYTSEGVELLQTFHDHTRPGAMQFAWADAESFLTGSSDKSAHYYRLEPEEGIYTKRKSYYFNGIVEAIAYGANQFIVSIRSDCYLHYIDGNTLEKRRINMNMDDIEHVSYTIMDLQVLGDQYLLAATDPNRHFIVRIGDNQPLRELYGHDADSYGQPRLVVDSTLKYVISNTQKTGELLIWSLASEQVVLRLSGHSAMVRDIAYCHGEEQMLSTDYSRWI